MSEAHHGGINAGGNISVGGDINANVTSHTSHEPGFRDVSDDLRGRVHDLFDALAVAGLAYGPPLGQVVVDLQAEVGGTTARPARIERLLRLIENQAVQVTAIAAAVVATRQALTR